MLQLRTLFRTIVLIIVALALAHPTAASALYEAVLPSAVSEIQEATEDSLPVYHVDASLAPVSEQPGRIFGDFDLAYINPSSSAQSEIMLRMYPNGDGYGSDAMSLSDVRLDGELTAPTIADDPTLATLKLAEPLPPGESVQLTLHFETTIPNDPFESYGMFAYFSEQRTYNLAHWMPLLAGFDPEDGWLTQSPSVYGDPVFSNTALFDVRLLAPASLTFATSGVLVDETALGPLTELHWTAGPMRDFVMAASDQFEVIQAEAGDTTIRSYYLPGYDVAAADVLRFATESMAVYNEVFWPYPYRELNVVQTRLGDQAAGVEFPGLVFIGTSNYSEGNAYLEFTTVHEVAHQWWYGIVGNNQYEHAFLDEGLANQSSIIYKERTAGPEAAMAWVNDYLKRPYLTMLFGRQGDQIVDQPTAAFPSMASYGRTVYAKGALGFEALRAEAGDRAYFEGMRSYVEQELFDVASPGDLLRELNETSSTDLSGLWHHWFEATEGMSDFGPEDLLELNG